MVNSLNILFLTHRCIKYLEIVNNLPDVDQIEYHKEMKRIGMVQRALDSWRNLTGRKVSQDNIFIPTATMQLFQHLHDIIPKHKLILGDFDSFIMPKVTVNGINAPIVSDKLAKPSDWETFST